MTDPIPHHRAGEPLPSADWNKNADRVTLLTPSGVRQVIMGTGPGTSPVAKSWPTVDVTHPPFNAVGDGITDDTTAIQSAATAAAGLTLFFPKPANYYKITGPIAIAANTTIVLDPGVIIEQVTAHMPVFDCNLVDGVSVNGNGALLRYTGARAYAPNPTFRGDVEYAYAAGVWSSGSRTHVRNLRVEGFTEGVHLSGWNGTALTAYAKDSNVIENVRVATVDFGVLATGQTSLVIQGLRGIYAISSGAPNPPHLIYISNGARHRQIAISDCEAWDGVGGHAYVYKGIDGGTVKNISARNCEGLLTTGGLTTAFNTDVVTSNIAGRDMATTGDTGAIYMQGNDLRCRFDGISIHQTVNERAIRLDGIDCAMSNVTIRSRHTTTPGSPDVRITGTRNTIDGISILNLQDDGTDYATVWRGILFEAASVDCVVRPLTLRNVQIGVETLSGATNPTIDLSGAKITATLQKISNASTTARVIAGDDLVSADNGDAAKTLTALVDDTTQRWNTPLTAARAVTLSTTGAYRGAKFRIVREAGATGAFNLNIGTGPLKALTAAGQWAHVEYDGTAWRLTANGSL